jgi:hypothetical protein
MTLTEKAAWYGATLSSIVLLWDFFKWWRSGVHLRVNVYPNMIQVGGAATVHPDLASRRFVRVEVINVGNKKTKMTSLAGRVYTSRWARLFRREPQCFVVADSQVQNQLPAMIEPGDRWAAHFEQDERFTTWAREHVLLLDVHHTMAARPIAKRVWLENRP